MDEPTEDAGVNREGYEREGASLVQPLSFTPSQPWRRFWPPTLGSEAYQKLQAEHPQVLTWRFDLTRPFDRPWRLWTHAMGQPDEHMSFPPDRQSAAVSSPIPETIAGVQEVRSHLDEQIRKLNLPTVRPEQFHHLAPLELYRRQKPYKCQLPESCFGGFKMHNLVSQSYPVTIADITGHESLFSLAVSGFEFAKCPLAVQDWSDACVSSEYLPRLVEWLKGRLGCRDVFCYAYNVRPCR